MQIFFSYAEKDRDFAVALSNQLVKRGFRVWIVLVRPTKDIPWILRKFKILDGKQNLAKLGAYIAEALKQIA